MSTLNGSQSKEEQRLEEEQRREKNWKRWGPYLADRQWATVREDYSAEGNSWDYFPHHEARSRAYRWGEDGLLGFTDRQCRLCFSLALWNERDPILKERLFGLTSLEGNHGEDVKEYYYYLDSTPTHTYLKALYKYPQVEYPYERLVEENRRADLLAPEFELYDTGVFDQNRYFNVGVEYAKAAPEDILIRIKITNQGPEAARLHLLPTLWFRNTWSWGPIHEDSTLKPQLSLLAEGAVLASHPTLGEFHFHCDPANLQGTLLSSCQDDSMDQEKEPIFLFTENETNYARLFNSKNKGLHTKDAFHEWVIHRQQGAINPDHIGTKMAPHYQMEIGPGETKLFCFRLQRVDQQAPLSPAFGEAFEAIFKDRVAEADAFYQKKFSSQLSPEEEKVARQAYAGLLWNKQFYHYIVTDWLQGDPDQLVPPPERLQGRNYEWNHFYSRDILSMPDKWEYPWFAAWDTAFHMLPFSQIDSDFAKNQLTLLLREWYMRPNGQLPAYEFNLGDVNPPVHAWAAWRVYKITGKQGQRDRCFLESVFQKLLLNFTWWVNRKDPQGDNIFSGGFLGLDNIGVFDRSNPLPTGGVLQQADGTAWMAFYCLTMLSMALELAEENPIYQDLATKFFEHFIEISDAINTFGGTGLWDETDGFYYDQLRLNETQIPLKTRSMVGLIPLMAVEVFDENQLERCPAFAKRMRWFLNRRWDLFGPISSCHRNNEGNKRLLAIPSRERLERTLRYMLDENEFFSPHGIRSLSRVHAEAPYSFRIGHEEYRVDYTPGESNSYLFGGNSNWRGPVWFPINYLLVEALERYHYFYGNDFKIECPTGSGQWKNLGEIAQELSQRLVRLFLPNEYGARPAHGMEQRYANDPDWKDLVLFYEYFHGETGRGCGASHQTGWTSLVVRLLDSYREKSK